MVDFGRRSGMRVIAEGIETAEDLRALLVAGVELGQGYWMSQPLALDTIHLPSLRRRLKARLTEALAEVPAGWDMVGMSRGRHTSAT